MTILAPLPPDLPGRGSPAHLLVAGALGRRRQICAPPLFRGAGHA